MKTTCLYCGLSTEITPDATRCTECGGDLEALIIPEYAAEFYYQQAQEQAFQGDAKQALSTIRRGLDEYDSPDLHLLAAILHQRMGEFDQMRAHVAAIPIDDALRPEGEWLLRSHQARQRSGRRRSTQSNNDTLAMTPFGQPADPRKPARRRRAVLWAVPVMAVLLLAVGGWWTWQNGMLDSSLQQLGLTGIPGLTQNTPTLATDGATGGATGGAEVNNTDVAPADAQEAAPAQETILPTPTPLPTTPPPDNVVQNSGGASAGTANTAANTDAGEVTTLVNSPVTDPGADTGADTAADTTAAPDTDTDTNTAGGETTDSVANPATETGGDGSTAEAAPSPVASSDKADAAALAALPEIDLALLLNELGASDLSDLPITANRQGSEIVLIGTTLTAEQRTRIITLLTSVPGVETVDALNLVVRVADTYTTRPGDNLWKIAEMLYGDGRRWQDIYALNRDILGLNPSALFANMELKLPPVQ